MELNQEQYKKIRSCFSKQRKPTKISNLDELNVVLYLVENGGLPKEYGDWHVIYVRINRWAKKGILQATFLRLQQMGIIYIKVNVVSTGFHIYQGSSGRNGRFEKSGIQSICRTRGGWNTKFHMVAQPIGMG